MFEVIGKADGNTIHWLSEPEHVASLLPGDVARAGQGIMWLTDTGQYRWHDPQIDIDNTQDDASYRRQ